MMNKFALKTKNSNMKINAVQTFEEIKTKLHESGDLKSRNVQFFGTQIVVCYIAPITDNQLLNDTLIYPMLHASKPNSTDIISALKETVLSNQEVNEFENLDLAIQKLLCGNSLILVDGANKILGCDMEKIIVRAVSEPPSNVVVKGPREGFTESLKYNLALIRRRARTADLVVQNVEIGELTKTQVAVVYFNSIVDKDVVKHVMKRLNEIRIDGLVDSHYLISFLQKNPHSLFRQIGDTEKPDILLAKMLEGRVGIIVDGSPIVLTLPFILIEDMQNSDDYYTQPMRATFVRMLRLIGVILAVLLPGLYVALETFHYKCLPIEFLTTIMNSTQGIPFSPFMEILFVVLLFEILYEANLRMPQYLGMAMSIVGALILGETAIEAGLVSPPAVMIVALSGITFYIVPNQASQFSILRLVALIVGATTGIYGIIVFGVLIVAYLCSFDSYKSAYLAPLSPFIEQDTKDLFQRVPIKEMTKRPKSIANNKHNINRRRTNDDDKL